MDRLRLALTLVTLHYVANVAHGVAHAGVPVPLTSSQMAFVVLVVTVAPLVPLVACQMGLVRPTLGWMLLGFVLLVSLVFGVGYHYVVESPDHVANVPPGAWRVPFTTTAALVALVDGAGTVAAFWAARQAQGGSTRSPIESST